MEHYRIHAEAAVYYLTYSIVEWLPVFTSESSCKIVTDSLTFCHREQHHRINAFVIMPTHLHWSPLTSTYLRNACRAFLVSLGRVSSG
jgi:hypothetical protein